MTVRCLLLLLYCTAARLPGVQLALVRHEEDLHLLLEADGSLDRGGWGSQRQGGAAVVVAERVEGRPGGEGSLIAVGSIVTFNVDSPFLRGARRWAAPSVSNSRPSPLLLPGQHVPDRRKSILAWEKGAVQACGERRGGGHRETEGHV